MALTKPKISTLVASQLPEFVREEYDTFVSFLEAYYTYLESTQVDLKTLRDLDSTLDSFIKHFRNEYGSNIPYSTVSERFLLQHIKDQYKAKGSEASFKLLFRILFNKEVSIDYPSKQMLRASDGKWNQDVSVFAKILTGTPNDVVGKLVDVITPNKIIRVLVDRRQDVEVEVERTIRLSDTVYEFLIDRRFFGNVSVGDRLRYRNDAEGVYFTAEILATTTALEVQQAGSGFKVGQLYNIRNFNGYGSILKVSKVNSTGGIELAQFIKYGIGYSTDFTTTISAQSGQDVSGTSGTVIQRIGSNLNISEGLDGYSESGTINTFDYAFDPANPTAPAIDGTYAGNVLREFGISTIDSKVTESNPAIIKVKLGALAKYPGYYINNDGFLDDAIYIQDSRYYQAFSYVIKIDETLDRYKTAVKNLIHPAGMAMFGEYDIRNEFDISLELESLIRILTLSKSEEVTAENLIEIKHFSKYLDDYVRNHDNALEGHVVRPFDEIGTGMDRTYPYLLVGKNIINTTPNYDGLVEGHEVFMSSEVGEGLDRTGPFFDSHKTITITTLNYDGVIDQENVVPVDETGTGMDRTYPYMTFNKLVDATVENYDGVYDQQSVVMIEPEYPMLVGTRTGLAIIDMEKLLDAHILYDGGTNYEHVVMEDVTGSDLNRTVPAFILEKIIDPTISGIDISEIVDSGGIIEFNPYGEAGFFLNDSGLYVGTEILF